MNNRIVTKKIRCSNAASFKLPFRWLLMAVWLLLGQWQPLHAQQVRREDARKAATTFLQGIGANPSELTDVSEALGFSHLYAFNGSKGYVVLAADNSVCPVLCFSPDGHIDAAHLPEGISIWLNGYEQQIQYVVDHRLADENAALQWNDLIEGRTEGVQTRESIGPLLWSTWDMDYPYNMYCPYDAGADKTCTTGSVATSMGQIMHYWKHPMQGKGSHTIINNHNINNYSQQAVTANFGETTYDWNNMMNHYVFSNDVQKAAVATLLHHCAVAIDTYYDYKEGWGNNEHTGSYVISGDFDDDVQEGLVGNFYYKCPPCVEKEKPNAIIDDDQWMQMIKDALSTTPPHPILYSASEGASTKSHGFVCDGYKKLFDTDYIHLLTAHELSGCWCRINVMYITPEFTYCNTKQMAYFGIEPDSANITHPRYKSTDMGYVLFEGQHSIIYTQNDVIHRCPKGNTVTLTATPFSGYIFDGWTTANSQGSIISTLSELTIKVDHDEFYIPVFHPQECVVSTVVDPTGAGTVIGAGTYNYGDDCLLKALPNPGYAFEGWYLNGELWSTNSLINFHVYMNWNFTARFAATNYTVTLSPVPFLYSGTVSGAGSYPANTSVTVTATPLGNHQFMGWVENGSLVSSSPTYTFTLESDRNLLAIFGNGSQTGSGNIGSVVTNADGSQGVIFHIDASGIGWMVAMDDASEGCQWGPSTNIQLLSDRACNGLIALEDLSGFSNTGLIRTELGTDNDYAASQVNFDHGWYLPSAGQLRKLYAALPFVDSVLFQNGGTTISEDTYWSSTEYSSSDAASPMFAMSNSNKSSNHRVRAIRNYFSPQDNMVIAQPDSPTRGTVSVYNNGVYSYGDNAAVVATPKAGYLFDHWSEEGLPVSYNNIYTFTFTHSRQLTAHFVVSGGIGTLVHNADGSEGVVFYVNTDGTEGLMVALDDASEGCQWGPATNVMTLTDRPLNDIQALEDVAGYCNTSIIRASQGNDLMYAAGKVDFENGWYLPASGELRKLYAALPLIETALVRAGGQTLTEGTYWSSTEYSTSDASTPMFSMGNTNKTSTCRVRAIRKFLPSGIYSLVAKSENEEMGTATGSGTYTYNETVTVNAQANEGFVFESWTEDGMVVSYDATYQFPFTRNRVLVANFRVTGTVGEIVHNADGSTGVVFYQNADGTEGWMVALNDVSEGCAWGPNTNINALLDYPNGGLSVMEDVSGYANTDVIRRVNGTNNGYAATVVDFDNGWYLPSAGQLRKLYAALPMIEQSLLDAGGTLLTEDAYWSSTECSTSDAYCPMFATSTSSKSSSLRVRAIRTFNCSNVNMIRVKSNNLAFGGVVGGGNYELGATVSVYATPNPSYVFDHWEEDGCVVSYDQLYTFTFTRTRTLTAVFVRENSIGSIVHNADGTDGIVFYTYPSGIGGLMVALEDVSEGCQWGPNQDVTSLENQSPSAVMELLDDMDGRNNTQILRDWFGNNPDYAACKPDFANGWYLPSAGQLRRLYAALPMIERAIVDAGGTTLTEGTYWSSTERSASEAWTPMFAISSTGKTSNCRVRAIRSLTDTETIIANVNLEGAGTVTGAGWYDHGQTCTLKAQANNSYAFLNWTCGGSVVSTNMEYSFTVLGNQTYTANFVANSCNITTSFEPVNGGAVGGAGVYGMGEVCTLSATPNQGYTFYNWTSGNYEASTQPTFSFAVTQSAHYTAHFVINSYEVIATVFPEEGGTVTGAHAYNHGATATLTATPAEGYTFINWKENGVVVSTSPTYQFVVTGDRSLQANFEADAFVVTVDIIPSNSGTVEGDGAYNYGTQATLAAHSNVRYEFYGWMENDDVVSTDSLFTFGVTENRELFAVFVEIPFAIQVTANPKNGGMVSGGGVYEQGDTVTLTATANLDYTFINWTKYGMVVSTEPSFVIVVTEAASFVANFAPNSCEITVMAAPTEGGTVSGAGNYNYGSTCTLTATANAGYNFINWTKDGTVVSTNAIYSFTVTGSGTYVANFSHDTYTISASANPSNGGTVSGGGTYNYGDNCTLTATANAGYNFINWTKDGTVVSTNAIYSFTVTGSGTYVANFSHDTYTISASANPSNGGTVSGGGTYNYGDNCTLTATANIGYTFTNWTKNGTVVSTSAIYSFTVTGSGNYVANFGQNTYTISALANPSNGGTVNGGGTYNYGDNCTLTATANIGYNFMNWTRDGTVVSTSAIYSFTVTSSGTYVANFGQNTYTITATASPTEGGTVSGGGTYNYGDNCTLTATANEGYTFVNWTKGGTVVSTSPIYSFTVTSSSTYVANFGQNTYTISASANPSNGGTVNGGGTYNYGDNCTLTATANTGYNFMNWTKDGTVVSTNAIYSFTVTEDASYVANFELNGYTITATANPVEGGTVSGAGNYNYGSTCSLTATANAGYTFINWTKDGTVVSTNATYSFTVTEDASFVANFELNGYTITAAANPVEGGTVSGAGNYYYGSTCSLTATANTGYTFVNWTENGEVVSTDTEYTFMVTGNRNLFANFGQNTYTISASAIPSNSGSVSGAGNYYYGDTCTLTATPNTGFSFVRWTKNGTHVSTNATYSFTVTENASCVAYFRVNSYTISASANPTEGGTVNGGGTYHYGNNCTLTATANEDYTFVNWTENGEVVSTDTEYSFMVTGNRNLDANFGQNTYTISASANPSNGGTVNGGGTYNYGDNCTLTATANTGYTFTNWTKNGTIVSTNSIYSFTVTEDASYVANFELNSYTITATANPTEGGIVTGAGTYNHGSTCTLTATANIGYTFINWTKNGTVVSTSAIYSFTVTSSGTYVANFELNSYTITVIANPTEGGTVTGAGTYNHGATAILMATANTGYTFTNWTKNGIVVSTNPTYSFTVTEDVSYVANFELNSYTITVTANPTEGGTVTGAGSYNHGATATLMATANTGYTFTNWTKNGTVVSSSAIYSFTVIGSGTYVANFGQNTYTISASANPSNGGTVSGGGTYNYGDNCTLTATANTGYTFINWTKNGTVVSSSAIYSFTVTGSGTYVANFNRNTYTISASANPTEGGTVSGAGTYNYGATATLMATANTGYNFMNWTKDGMVVSTNPTYSFTVTEDVELVANFTSDSGGYYWTVNVNQYPNTMTAIGVILIDDVEQMTNALELGAFCGTECRGRERLAYISQMDRYMLFLTMYGDNGDELNFRLYDHALGQELDVICTNSVTFATNNTLGTVVSPYEFSFMEGIQTQTSSLPEGWSWWSTYIEQDGIDGLTQLENSLGENGVMIKSQSEGFTSRYGDYWFGLLNSINNESSYLVQTSGSCDVSLTGHVAVPSEHPITLLPGWTWIGYPNNTAMSVSTALSNLNPSENDMLKAQESFSVYYPSIGWFGSLQTIMPGMGLMYESHNTSSVTLTYSNPTRTDDLAENVTARTNHWNPDVYAYPNNMNVMAVVEVNGEELQSEDYELAAFANGECRGSAKLMYVEQLHRYMAFLTLHGDDEAELSFGLYDNATGMTAYKSDARLIFAANAVVGSPDNPMVVSFSDITGIDSFGGTLHVFPNPVERGSMITIGTVEESDEVRVEIMNAVGAVLSTETSTKLPANIKAPEVPGVYMLRITSKGRGIRYVKLIVS